MEDISQVVPQSLRTAQKQPLDGRYRFDTIDAENVFTDVSGIELYTE